jgi:hypothetical protein
VAKQGATLFAPLMERHSARKGSEPLLMPPEDDDIPHVLFGGFSFAKLFGLRTLVSAPKSGCGRHHRWFNSTFIQPFCRRTSREERHYHQLHFERSHIVSPLT